MSKSLVPVVDLAQHAGRPFGCPRLSGTRSMGHSTGQVVLSDDEMAEIAANAAVSRTVHGYVKGQSGFYLPPNPIIHEEAKIPIGAGLQIPDEKIVTPPHVEIITRRDSSLRAAIAAAWERDGDLLRPEIPDIKPPRADRRKATADLIKTFIGRAPSNMLVQISLYDENAPNFVMELKPIYRRPPPAAATPVTPYALAVILTQTEANEVNVSFHGHGILKDAPDAVGLQELYNITTRAGKSVEAEIKQFVTALTKRISGAMKVMVETADKSGEAIKQAVYDKCAGRPCFKPDQAAGPTPGVTG